MGNLFTFFLFLVPSLGLVVPERVVSTLEGAQESFSTDTSSPIEVQEYFPLPQGFQSEAHLDEKKPSLAAGGKVVKIRQGPFKVAPGRQVPSIDQWIPEPNLPCKDCYITAIQGGLEYEDGSPAELDTGAMLQHLIILTGGRDEVCKFWNLPQPNRLYATGNERETIRVNHGGSKYGLYLGGDEFFGLRFNVVNNGKRPINVFLVQKYEYIPKAEADGYREVKTAWMDIGGCGGTLFSPTSGKYSLQSKIWTSTMKGQILFVQGHVHEGGLNTTLYINQKPICVSSPIYGRKSTSIDPFGKKHISDNSVCTNAGQILLGDEVQIATHYDSAQHPYDPSMPQNGFESIMAITNMYVAA